jgi:hypothetical protein
VEKFVFVTQMIKDRSHVEKCAEQIKSNLLINSEIIYFCFFFF